MQKTNFDSVIQDESFSNENIKSINNNSKLLLKIIQNNQRKIMLNECNVNNNIDGNIYNNFLLNIQNIPSYNYNFCNYNSIKLNNINNYNNLLKFGL